MRKSFLAYPFLQLRNTMHAVAPEWIETVESIRQTLHFKRAIKQSGYQVPLPAFIKRSILKRHLLDSGLQTLVETGTQYGDTPWLFRRELSEIWSIELSPELARLARRRFQRYPHIHIVEGDSSERLPEIVNKLHTPTLFWLDGHYSSGVTAQGSSDCPIYAELSAIFTGCRQRFVVLIDDARCFGTLQDYPSIDDLEKFVANLRPEASVAVENDIICIRILH